MGNVVLSSLRLCVHLLIFHEVSPSGQIVNAANRPSPPEEGLFSRTVNARARQRLMTLGNFVSLRSHTFSSSNPTLEGLQPSVRISPKHQIWPSSHYFTVSLPIFPINQGYWSSKALLWGKKSLWETQVRDVSGGPGACGVSIFPKAHARGFLTHQ